MGEADLPATLGAIGLGAMARKELSTAKLAPGVNM